MKTRIAWSFTCKHFVIGTHNGSYIKWEYLYKLSNRLFTFTVYNLTSEK